MRIVCAVCGGSDFFPSGGCRACRKRRAGMPKKRHAPKRYEARLKPALHKPFTPPVLIDNGFIKPPTLAQLMAGR